MNEISNKELTDKKEEILSFINAKFNENDLKKIHYNSLVNIIDGIIYSKIEKKSQPSRYLLIEYFKEIEKIENSISNENSLRYYKDYIVPIGRYLMKYDRFYSKYDFHWHFYIGIILDSILFFFDKIYFVYNFPLPFFTITLTALGFYKKIKACNEKRYFAYRW